jgi:hypothetical protein
MSIKVRRMHKREVRAKHLSIGKSLPSLADTIAATQPATPSHSSDLRQYLAIAATSVSSSTVLERE